MPPTTVEATIHFKVEGTIGGEIEFEITEEIQEAVIDGPDGLKAWRNGSAFHLIPPEEAASRGRYENDPVKKGVHVGQFRSGIHFGEISTMQLVRAEGFKTWLYEVYNLFEPGPSDKASLTHERTQLASSALGVEVAEALRQAARMYQEQDHKGRLCPPRVPDIMAWRDVADRRLFRFVESKNWRTNYYEPFRAGQLLGLAIIALVVPNSDVHVYRWLESDRFRRRRAGGTLVGKRHKRVFRPVR